MGFQSEKYFVTFFPANVESLHLFSSFKTKGAIGLLPGKKSCSNFRSWIQFVFVAPNAIGSLTGNLTGCAPVVTHGIHSAPAAVAQPAVR